jgi:hypothetical protein
MAVLGEVLAGASDRDARWEARLPVLDFDRARNLVDWTELRAVPTLALRLRLSLLDRKFDVAVDAALTDWAAQAPEVESGEERIYFWGTAEAVAEVRSWIALGRAADRDLERAELGTITYVSEHHGRANVQIADHLASTTSEVSGLAVGILTCGDIFAEGTPVIRTEIRNRRPGGPAPSGLAGHILSMRELRMSYWGVVPWYVGWGEHEMLDYCESPARPERTRELIESTPGFFIADPEERAFARSLVELNLGQELDADGALGDGSAPAIEPHWDLHAPSPLLMPWSRLVVRPRPDGRFVTLREALAAADAVADAACVTAEIPIEDERFMTAQRQLGAAGFQLSALAPPVAGDTDRLGFVGLWSRVSSGRPMAAPYYLDSRLLTPSEKEVAHHVRRISDRWDGYRDARAA